LNFIFKKQFYFKKKPKKFAVLLHRGHQNCARDKWFLLLEQQRYFVQVFLQSTSISAVVSRVLAGYSGAVHVKNVQRSWPTNSAACDILRCTSTLLCCGDRITCAAIGTVQFCCRFMNRHACGHNTRLTLFRIGAHCTRTRT
jgi:hypothetical protein